MMKCTSCWQGNYVDGVCNRCSHTHETQRRYPDALPLMCFLNNRYQVGSVLGKGGFGITYSAWDTAMHRRVALKELFPSTSVVRTSGDTFIVTKNGHDEYVGALKMKFKNEARLLCNFATSCDIVKVYDFFESNNTVYYAMEFLEGCDLNVYRKKKGILSWEFLRPIMKKILETLSIIHKKNIIHRDISPDNIFLLRDNTVRLIDFGAARTYSDRNSNITVMKKDGFAPIEQVATNGKQGPWTDIYALSATMYLLLSGKLPPSSEKRLLKDEVCVPLKQLCPNLPDNVVSAIEKGMSIQAEDRFQTAEEYMAALGFNASSYATKGNNGRQSMQGKSTATHNTSKQSFTEQPVRKNNVYFLYGKSGVYVGRRRMLSSNKEISLGRKPTCDMSFPESTAGVSRVQCVIFINNTGEAFIKDAGSSYGTQVDGKKLGTSWVRIYPGNQIRFGMELFEFGVLKN